MNKIETTAKGLPLNGNLTDLVTVFVTTVGDAANFNDCMASLNRQDTRFRVEVLDRIAPMSAAFQAMIDRCETPFYVQLDEDMLLRPIAVRTLYESLAADSTEKVAIACWPLWDEHLNRSILGVKVYRHSAMKQVPYRLDVPHCDVEQSERLKAAGYETHVIWRGFNNPSPCLGSHGAHYTPETAFEAYRNRAAKSRMFPEWMSWVRALLPEFLERYRKEPTELNLFAFLGFATGMTTDLEKFNHEKDWRVPMDDFRRLAADLDATPPTELSLHVTGRCNLACSWCKRQTTGTPRKPDMTAAFARHVLKELPSVRSVCIAGFGEPLLCPELAGIIRQCKIAGKHVGLITNGTLLTQNQRIEELVDLGVDQVSVSLNAANRERYAETTGSDSFEDALAGIRAVVAAMPGRVALSMVCHKGNFREMDAFLTLASDVGAAFVDFLNLLPHGFDRENPETFWHQVLRDDDPEVKAEIDELRHRHAAHMVRTWPALISRESCPRRCKSPYVSLSVDSEGFLSPCRRCIPPAAEFGKIQNGPLPWKTVAWYQLRAGIEGDTPLRPECRMCFGNFSG
jgi:molybdenum cofactor biosynthesis enzyme MoaA